MIREKMKEWKQMTFSELPKGYDDPKVLEDLWFVLENIRPKEMALATRGSMDGYCMSGINESIYWNGKQHKINENDKNYKLNGTQIYHSIPPEDVSPSVYLYQAVKSAQEKKLTHERMLFDVTRAFRSFASFIREKDLCEQLQEKFEGTFEMDEEADYLNHSDIIYTTPKGKKYYIWSFTNTDKGRRKAVEKLRGTHGGDIPNGYHLTCPAAMTEKLNEDALSRIQDEKVRDQLSKKGKTYYGWYVYDYKLINTVTWMLNSHIAYNYNKFMQGTDASVADKLALPRIIQKT